MKENIDKIRAALNSLIPVGQLHDERFATYRLYQSAIDALDDLEKKANQSHKVTVVLRKWELICNRAKWSEEAEAWIGQFGLSVNAAAKRLYATYPQEEGVKMPTNKDIREQYKGKTVRVVSGPYKDSEGTVVSVSGSKVNVVLDESLRVFFTDEVEVI